ncbi:MAG: indole-3-glycerol phosphate synthase TrpC [Ignavibacteriales bacterium]|nr:indole-3-glycerol phosphate synthase TrpC [Ignavibacteriales bacterium]
MNILDKIVDSKKQEVKKLRKEFSIEDFEKSPLFNKLSYSLMNHISSDKNISIIAEIKKASPSKGILKEDFNHLEIARAYFSQNVNGISVLTDEKYFQGNILYLKDIAEIKNKPLLRKDFIFDELQVYEAKANGADAILLIAEVLSATQIKELTLTAQQVGLEVLLELHSENQISKIDFGLNKLIGINNRNLESFITDIQTTVNISKLIPDDVLLVSESGIKSKSDVNILKTAEIDAVLVGKYFMKAKDIEESINEFKSWCTIES